MAKEQVKYQFSTDYMSKLTDNKFENIKTFYTKIGEEIDA